MKSASRFLSVMTLTLAAGMVISCARTESVSDFPHQFMIDARKIEATHRLNQCPNTAPTKIDLAVNFDSGSDKLTAAADAQLRKVAAILNDPSFQGSHVTAEGYTDAVGKPSKNTKLSYRRAQAVVHALVEKYGVPASMFSAQGFGAANPVATNSTAAGRAANRRVTFAVSSGK